MYFTIDHLITCVIISLFVLFLLSIVIDIYFKIRARFPKRVNCWFCNSWSLVPYMQRNSFICANCLQYNGFTTDGDYNVEIPEQFNGALNKPVRPAKFDVFLTNGLCGLCNYKQELRINQLASFEPMNAKRYDVEIEHFEKQLEKTYELCSRCKKHTKSRLEKQNAWVCSTYIKNMRNGETLGLNLAKSSIQTTNIGQKYFLKIIRIMLRIITCVILLKITYENILLHQDMFPLPLNHKLLKLDLTWLHFDNVLNIFHMSCAGLILQCCLLMEPCEMNVKVNQIFCWFVLMFTTLIKPNSNMQLWTCILQVMTMLCVLYYLNTSYAKPINRKQINLSNYTREKIRETFEQTWCNHFIHSGHNTDDENFTFATDIKNVETSNGYNNSKFRRTICKKRNEAYELNNSLNRLSLNNIRSMNNSKCTIRQQGTDISFADLSDSSSHTSGLGSRINNNNNSSESVSLDDSIHGGKFDEVYFSPHPINTYETNFPNCGVNNPMTCYRVEHGFYPTLTGVESYVPSISRNDLFNYNALNDSQCRRNISNKSNVYKR